MVIGSGGIGLHENGFHLSYSSATGLDDADTHEAGGEGSSRISDTYSVSELTELLCDVGEPRPSNIEILHGELV